MKRAILLQQNTLVPFSKEWGASNCLPPVLPKYMLQNYGDVNPGHQQPVFSQYALQVAIRPPCCWTPSKKCDLCNKKSIRSWYRVQYSAAKSLVHHRQKVSKLKNHFWTRRLFSCIFIFCRSCSNVGSSKFQAPLNNFLELTQPAVPFLPCPAQSCFLALNFHLFQS